MDTRDRLDENGHEVLDPRPLQMPSGFKRPETLAEQVQRLVRTSLSAIAEANGDETFDEADDFDVGDDVDPHSPYETFFDPVLGRDLTLDEFRRNEAIYRQKFLEEQQAKLAEEDKKAAIDAAIRNRPKGKPGNARVPDVPASPPEPEKPEKGAST